MTKRICFTTMVVILVLMYGCAKNPVATSDSISKLWLNVKYPSQAPLVVNDSIIITGYMTQAQGGPLFGNDYVVSISTNNGISWLSHIGLYGYSRETVSSFVFSGNKIFEFSTVMGVFALSDSSLNDSSLYFTTIGYNSGLGQSFFSLSSNVVECGLKIYFGTDSGLFYTTNNSSYTSCSATNLTKYNVTALAIIGNNFFAGTYNNGVFISTDTCTTWSAFNTGLTNNNIYSFVTSGNYIFALTASGIFYSTINAASWSAFNSGLTNTKVNSLAANGNNIFAGTDRGVFHSTISNANWTSIGLANKNVSSIGVNNHYIFALTNDSTVYRLPLSDVPGIQ